MRSSCVVVFSTLGVATPVLAGIVYGRDWTGPHHRIPRQQQLAQLSLPETTGPYQVGTVVLPLTDISRLNPFASAEQTNNTLNAYRRLVVSVFYPADIPSDGTHDFPYAPAFPPATASLLDGVVGAPPGTAALVKTRSYLGAPILLPTPHEPHTRQPRHGNQHVDDFPVLLFGHGSGGLRVIYTARMQELASRGWVVVNVDHTYDAQVVEFPDTGEIVPRYANDAADYDLIGGVEGVQKMRAADLKFVLEQLRTNETVRSQVPGLGKISSSTCAAGGSSRGELRMDRVGAFGHSLGGTSAAQAVSSYHEHGIVCGVNLDGAYWGELPTDGLLAAEHGNGATAQGLSFMQISYANVTRASRPSWGVFWESMQRQHVGVQRQFGVNGTEHNSFTDGALYYSMLGMSQPVDMYGTIEPLRMLEVEVGYVESFFSACLKRGALEELDGLHQSQYPETFIGE